jgi:site-specific DNA-methyltransferase (adenine-specific)
MKIHFMPLERTKTKTLYRSNKITLYYTSAYFNFSGQKRKETLGQFGNHTTTYKVHEKSALTRDVIKIPALAGGAGLKERFLSHL